MSAITDLLAARRRGDAGSLRNLALELALRIRPTPELPVDPAALWDAVEDRGAEAPGTWQEVRAAADHGELSEAEYEFLAAAVEALTEGGTR